MIPDLSTADCALSWAEHEAAHRPPTAYSTRGAPPRTRAARVAEVLARAYKELPPTTPEADAILAALLRHIEPVLKNLYWRGPCRGYHAVDRDDFLQEARARIVMVLRRYYDPERGSFINFAIRAARQAAHTLVGKRRRWTRAETPAGLPRPGTPLGYHRLPDKDAPLAVVVGREANRPAWLLGALRRFVAWYRRGPSPSPALVQCAEQLAALMETGLPAADLALAVARALGTTHRQARTWLVDTCRWFGDYAVQYEDTNRLLPGWMARVY